MTAAPLSSDTRGSGGGPHARYAALTCCGRVRRVNEDAVVADGLVGVGTQARLVGARKLADEDPMVFVVVDGMGGHSGGQDAAGLVAVEMARLGPQARVGDLTPLFEAVSDKVGRAGAAWGTSDMGATAAVLVVSQDKVTVANVGDARCYRLIDGYLGLLTEDDHEPGGPANVVTQSLGGSPRALDVHQLDFGHGTGTTRYLLCSDGLHGAVEGAAMKEALLACREPVAAVSALADMADPVSQDNYSIMVVDVTT